MNIRSPKLPASSLSGDTIRADYPLERICRHQYDPFQLNFARHALELFPQKERSAFEASHRGLVLRAQTEAALERAVEILRKYFGDQITISRDGSSHDVSIETQPPETARTGSDFAAARDAGTGHDAQSH